VIDKGKTDAKADAANAGIGFCAKACSSLRHRRRFAIIEPDGLLEPLSPSWPTTENLSQSEARSAIIMCL
jgi:hypothetical protein